MILPKFSPDLLVSENNNRTTTRIVSRNVPFQNQLKTRASRLATETGTSRPHKQVICIESRTKENPGLFFESVTRSRRRGRERNRSKRAESSVRSEEKSFSTSDANQEIIAITDSVANLNNLFTFQHRLDLNQCQQVATSRRDEFELCSQNKAPPNAISRSENSFALHSYHANSTSSGEIRFLRKIKKEKERGKGREIKRIAQVSPEPPKRNSSQEQMNHYADIERSSKILSNATPASDALSIELRSDDLQALVLSGAVSLEKEEEEEEEKERLSIAAQHLHYRSFKRNNQQQDEQQTLYHFCRKHKVSKKNDEVCSKRHTIGHQRRKRLMMRAPDYSCCSKKASLWRLLTSPLILLMCLVVLSIRTNLKNSVENSGSSFFSHRDNVFLSLGLVEASGSPKIDSFSLINSQSINPEKNHQKILHIQETRHELSKILKRVGRQRDYDDSVSSLDRYNNSDNDNEHEAVLSSSDYDSTYNNVGNTNDLSDDSKLQRTNDNNSSSSSSNQASVHNTADSGENGVVSHAIDGENEIRPVLDRTANNQSSATIFESRFENSNLSSTLIGSLFSHIDKQWNFAEVILIIVISAILNLVTIIGNIMVLISFKMDRSLQTVSNYFLLSLALADLLIGLISMPLYTLYLLLNYWPLGPLMCDIWLAIDYLNSNAAVLNMLIISFDRYFSVTRPLTYRAKRTTKHACLMISCAWILSLTIWTPAIFTYPYYKGRTVQGTDKCEIEFVKANTYLTFVTAILAFYIPVIIMIYLYWRIWLETKKRYRDLTTLFLVSGVGAAAPARATRPIHNPVTSQALPLNQVSTTQHRPSISRNIKLTPALVQKNNESNINTGSNNNNIALNDSSNNNRSSLQTSLQKKRPSSSEDRTQQENKLLANMNHDQKFSNCQGSTNCLGNKNKYISTNHGCKNVIHNQQHHHHQQNQQQQQQQKCKCPCCPKNTKGIKVKKSPKRCSIGCNYKPSFTPDDCSKCQQNLKDHFARCHLCSQTSYNNCLSCNNSMLKSHNHQRSKNQFVDSNFDNKQTNKDDGQLSDNDNDDDDDGAKNNNVEKVICSTALRDDDKAAKSNGTGGKKRRQSGHSHSHSHSHHYSHCNHGYKHNHAGNRRNHHHHKSSRHCNAAATPTTEVDKSTLAPIHHGHNHYPNHHSHHHHHHHHSHHNHKIKHDIECDQLYSADKQGKLSILTSSYQLLSSNTKSLSSASILRKVHPTSGTGNNNDSINAENNNSSGIKESSSSRTDKANLDEAGKCTSLSCGALTCEAPVANYIALGTSEPIFNKITQPDVEGVITVDTATSPIQFPSSPTRLNFAADEDSHIDRDFETRIVSSGDKFKFESDDLRLSPMFKLDKIEGDDSSRTQLKKAPEISLKKPVNCKHCHWENLSSCHTYKQGAHSNRCCCAKVISNHDSDCRICNPIGGAHTSKLNSRPFNECLECNKLTLAGKTSLKIKPPPPPSPAAAKTTNTSQSEQESKLPILGVLRKCSEAGNEVNLEKTKNNSDLIALTANSSWDANSPNLIDQDTRHKSASTSGGKNLECSAKNSPKGCIDRKRTKKFSQKLTFSDILVERASLQRGENSDSSKSRLSDTFDIQFKSDQGSSQAGAANFNRNLDQENNSDGFESNNSRRLPVYLNWFKGLFSRTNKRVLMADRNQGYGDQDEDVNGDGADIVSGRRKLSPKSSTKSFKGQEQQSRQTTTLQNSVNKRRKRHLLNKLCCSNAKLTQFSSRNTKNKSIKQSNEPQFKSSSSTDDSDNTGNHNRNNNGSNNSSSGNTKLSYSSHHPIQPKSERKAAKTLSTLLLVFIVTWLPYNVLVLIKTLSGGEDQVPEKIWNFSYYLCYINSTINPLCYALCNVQFRRTYVRILRCKLYNEHNSTRRLVPLQSSTTWNKDLRLTTPETNSTNQTSSYSASNHNGYNSRHKAYS